MDTYKLFCQSCRPYYRQRVATDSLFYLRAQCLYLLMLSPYIPTYPTQTVFGLVRFC
ncbi:hypothetical protein HOLleu_20615 [Holothuria leucospilota]|uniref:Uncharacterized protein n=1 Tax=Holothuria leucospilota TaxID=206669 RepID=A0A9Q1C1A5_HOLLE|nr:hypothetical protein HOLleu_20615 [Holothuria leucospilota]